MKNKNLFWGLYLILAAVILVFAQLNWFEGKELFKIAVFILLMPVIIKSALHLMFGGIFFPLAIVMIVLNITNLSIWVILLSALLLTIGCHLIFGNGNVMFGVHTSGTNGGASEGNFTDTDGVINYSVSFGESIKYVSSENFKRADLRCSFGDLTVYFDNAKVGPEGAEIYVDVSFGAIELYVPRNWKIINCANVFLAGVDERGRADSDGVSVKLLGNVSFAGVEIRYI